MPDDVGGKPYPDGGEPDDDRGGADQDFASVVFDEDFVRSATIHEPSAVERQRAAEAARAVAGGYDGPDAFDPYDAHGYGHGPDGDPLAYGPDGYPYGYGPGHGPYGIHGGALRPYRGRSRWLRPVAWVLAVVMGVGMVALAFTAVYRGAANDPEPPAPAPTTSPLTEVTGTGAFMYPVSRQP
ncbi:SCO2584 family spore wall biosynthesis protein [Streptomyces antimicrobicus]|uniref:Uncharacterized protein n=1 Tax=Streptomyces antimicrobicus TaxID=2883108 RepID=A0ABS8B0R8_9ACTN|nr:hypothetical protein [Streptomyces antimicrobicus]MCB5178192.1 hypothetical protein [Streptomyces antimicrobicus]